MVQGLGFLSKKSLHTKNLVNQEKVWIAEQRKEAEAQKTQELAKQIRQEIEQEELDKISGHKSGSSKRLDRGIDWMYQGNAAGSELAQEDAARKAEEFLMGKEFVGGAAAAGMTTAQGDFDNGDDNQGIHHVLKDAEMAQEAVAAQAAAAPPASAAGLGEPSVKDRNEDFRMRVEDPMFLVSRKQREKEVKHEQTKALYERVVGYQDTGDKSRVNKDDDDSEKRRSRKRDKKDKKRDRHLKKKKSSHRKLTKRREAPEEGSSPDQEEKEQQQDYSSSEGDRKRRPRHHSRRRRSLSRSVSPDRPPRKQRHKRSLSPDALERSPARLEKRHKRSLTPDELTRSPDRGEDRHHRRHHRDDNHLSSRRRSGHRDYTRRGGHSEIEDNCGEDNKRQRDDDKHHDRGREYHRRHKHHQHHHEERHRHDDRDRRSRREGEDHAHRRRDHNDSRSKSDRGPPPQQQQQQQQQESQYHRPPPKKEGYGLKMASGNAISTEPINRNELGPSRELLQRKRDDQEVERRRIREMATSRRRTTEVDRTKALEEMQANARQRDEHHRSRQEQPKPDHGMDDPVGQGGASFLKDITQQSHGIVDGAQSLSSRVAQNRHTNQRLHDSFL